MPLFYLWLFTVAGGVTASDYYIYEYKMWYLQGIAMVLIVLIAILTYGCGMNHSKTEK